MFAIEFLTEPQIDGEGWLHAEAELLLGADRELLEVDLTAWTLEDYRHHWRQAITRLVAGAAFTRLVTSYRGPHGNYHFTWPMWREGDLVVVHEQLILDEDLPAAMNPSVAWELEAARFSPTEGEPPISEWDVPLSALKDWLARPSPSLGTA